jgi:hypothetical protein
VGSRRERALVIVVVGLLVVARSAIFVFWEQSYFDSDQAVIGLMAKHLSELRAFPVFMYGQHYILAVEAWMAAPVFLVAGVSVATLKLPLLLINLAVAFLLVWILEREAYLRPLLAGVATLFFVLPAPGTAAHLLEASGGNLEPFLYILLLWLTRRRPVWFGGIFAIGFLHREFTVYGVLAVAIIGAINGSLFTRQGLRGAIIALESFVAVWVIVQLASEYSSAAGPGTSIADVHAVPAWLEVKNRLCVDPRTMLSGVHKLVTVHWVDLFGLRAQPVLQYAIDSGVSQGLNGSWVFLAGAMLLALTRIVVQVATEGRVRKEHEACAYLTLAGLISAGIFAVSRCGGAAPMRYDLLSILGAVGLGAWYLCVEQSRVRRAMWMLLVAGWVGVSALGHARLWSEYLTHPPYGVKRAIVRALDARGVRYGSSDYWIAYYVTFLTNERIIMRTDDFMRILSYDRDVLAHSDQTVTVARMPCRRGEEAVPGVYFCPP